MANDTLAPKKILVIEDDGSVLSILTNALGKQGFIMMGARNGEEGLQMCFKEHPDLVLLDIIMPKMDGIDMLKRLRQDPWGKNVPVIVLTNLNQADKVSTALANEVFDYFVKANTGLDEVIDKVKERLGLPS
jgi:CheY-like chemotaxis protein